MRTALLMSLGPATLLALAACATPPAPQPPAMAMQCTAEAGVWAVGKPVSDELVSKIQSDTHSRAVRVLRPGQPATMDFRGDRVNVMLDGQDRVERVTCG